jgi:hypothetical protein
MSTVSNLATRRRVLKGVMGGAAISVGLPFLDCFLNSNGTALASTGQRLPDIYSTWYWGLGTNPGRWAPEETGKITKMNVETEALEPFKDRINVYSGMRVFLDGRPAITHFTGNMSVLTGTTPRSSAVVTPSIDTLIADHISSTVRFRSLELTSTGNPKHMYSFRPGGVFQPGEAKPADLYARLFGPDFRDPNAGDFTPDPAVMARQSVLSAVREQRQGLERIVGASDRARLDEYFTSLRQVEQQVELMLQQPAPLEACSVPGQIDHENVGTEVTQLKQTHKLNAQLAAYAFACDQTRVVNLVFNDMTSSLRREGSSMIHHIYTHEEAVDEATGIQPNATYFVKQCMSGFADYLEALDSIREGDKTLLDRVLVYAITDTSYAKVHSVENMPQFTAGGANGRMKTGIHYAGAGDPTTRVGLTVQQALGLPVNSWGTDSMATSKTITEVLA